MIVQSKLAKMNKDYAALEQKCIAFTDALTQFAVDYPGTAGAVEDMLITIESGMQDVDSDLND